MKKYKFLILSAAVIFAAAAGYFLLTGDKALEVSTMKSYKGSIIKTIEVSGTINSKEIETISLETGRLVKKTYVKENDVVEKNQLLAELENDDLIISLEKSMLSLEDLNTKLNSITSDNSELVLLNNTLARNKESYSKLTEDLKTAKEDLKKAEALYTENVISKSELDKYVTQVNNLSSNLKTAELNLNDASVNYNDKKEQKTQDKQSIERQIKSVNLDIESLNKKIEDSKIYSSINGIVTDFPIKELQKTLAGEIITIHGNDSLELTAHVSQQDAILIKEGQQSIVTVDGLNLSYEGKVSFVSKLAETDKNGSTVPKVEIKIEILNADENLSFGYEGEAEIIIDSKEDVLVVKNEAIKKEDDKNYVYLLQNNQAKLVYVEMGLSDGYLINILSGVNEGDEVIVNPPVSLIDGMKVNSVK